MLLPADARAEIGPIEPRGAVAADEAPNYARDAVELLLLIGTEVMSDLNHLVCDQPVVVCRAHNWRSSAEPRGVAARRLP